MFVYKKLLSVILPAYNEGSVIAESIERLSAELDKFSENHEIIVVNDGSTDDTKQKVLDLKKRKPEVKLISYKNNKGKGYAIKRGLLAAKGDAVVLIDADLDIHPCQIRGYLKKMLQARKKDSSVAGAIGSKLDRRSNVDFPAKRRIMSYGYFLILKTLFRLDTMDTNTGLKVFNGSIIKDIAPILCIRGYAYDIELLSNIYKKNHRVLSLPVQCSYSRENSAERIKIKHAVTVFNETMTVFMRNHFYD